MKRKSVFKAVVALFATLLGINFAQATQSISVNFRESASDSSGTIPSGTMAGILEIDGAYWNHPSGSSGSDIAVTGYNSASASIEATPVKLTYASANTWASSASGNGNSYLCHSYLDDGSTSSGYGATITLTGIPYSTYTVYIYPASGQGSNGTFRPYYVGATIDSVTAYPSSDTTSWGSTAATTGEVTYDTSAESPTNYIKITGLSSETLVITGSVRSGSMRGSIGGFQIVNEGEDIVSGYSRTLETTSSWSETAWSLDGVATEEVPNDASATVILTTADDGTLLTMDSDISVGTLTVEGTGALTFAAGESGGALTASSTLLKTSADISSGVTSLGATTLGSGATLKVPSVSPTVSSLSMASDSTLEIAYPDSTGAGTLEIPASQLSGNVTISQGTITIATTGELTNAQTVTVTGASSKLINSVNDPMNNAQVLAIADGATVESSLHFRTPENLTVTGSGTYTITGVNGNTWCSTSIRNVTLSENTTALFNRSEEMASNGVAGYHLWNTVITVPETSTMTIDAPLMQGCNESGSGNDNTSLTKRGEGNLILTAPDSTTYGIGSAPTFTVEAGTLTVQPTSSMCDMGSVTISVSNGATLALDSTNAAFTLSNTITGAGTLEVVGANGVTIPGTLPSDMVLTVGENAKVILSGTLTTDLTSASNSFAATSTLVVATPTLETCLSGVLTLPAGVTVGTKIAYLKGDGTESATATVTQEDIDAGTITVATDPTITGSAWYWDFEFQDSTGASSVANTGSTASALNWDGSHPFATNDSTSASFTGDEVTLIEGEDGNYGLHIQSRPYINAKIPSAATAILRMKALDTNNSVIIGFGTLNAGTITILTGEDVANNGDMRIVYTSSSKVVTDLVSNLRVPNATTAYHLYAFTIQTVDSKTQISVYLDGALLSQTTLSSEVSLGTGFQIGGIHGGLDGLTGFTRCETETDEDALIDFLRVSSSPLSSAEIATIASAYPYTSPNGGASRAVSAEETWSQESAWTQTTAESTEGTTQAEPDAGTEVTVTFSGTAALTNNLSADAAYESLTLTGTGENATLAIAGDDTATGDITISGRTTISGGAVTLDMNRVTLSTVTVNEGASLTLDCTDYPICGDANIALTGYVDATTADRIEVIGVDTDHFATTPYFWTSQYNEDTGAIELVPGERNTENITSITAIASSSTNFAGLSWLWNEVEDTAYVVTGVPTDFTGDLTLTSSASGLTVTVESVVQPSSLTISGPMTIVTPTNLQPASGSIAINADVTLAVTEDLTMDFVVGSEGTLTLSTSTDSTLSGDISGEGNVAIAGSAVTTLSGANTYAGTTTIASGATLTLGEATTVLTGAIVNEGTLNVSGTLSIGDLSGLGVLNNTGTLTVNGTALMSASETTSGTITVANGAALNLKLTSDQIASGFTASNVTIAEAAEGATVGTVTFVREDGSEISASEGSSGVNEEGIPTFTTAICVLSPTSATVNWSATANWAEGVTPPTSGAVNIDVSALTDTEVTITMDADVSLDRLRVLGSDTQTVKIGTTSNTLSAEILEVASANFDATGVSFTSATIDEGVTLTYAPTADGALTDVSITGAGALAIGGTSTVTVSSAVSHTGGTTILSGATVTMTEPSLIGTVTVNDGATIEFTHSSDTNATGQNFSGISGTGTIRFTGTGWRTLPITVSNMPASTLTFENNVSSGLVLTNHNSGAYVIGSLAGTGTFRADWYTGERTLTIVQAKNTEFSGTLTSANESSRLTTITVQYAENATAETATLTLSGTTSSTYARPLVVDGSVKITGGYEAATITVGSTGTLTLAPTSSMTLPGTISGDGTIEATVPAGATLTVNGSLAGTLSVAEGGTLAGTGTLSGATTFADGAILNIEGNTTSTGLTFSVEPTIEGTLMVSASSTAEEGTVIYLTGAAGGTAAQKMDVTGSTFFASPSTTNGYVLIDGSSITINSLPEDTTGSGETISDTALAELQEIAANDGMTTVTFSGEVMGNEITVQQLNGAIECFDNIISANAEEGTIDVSYDFGISSIKPQVAADGTVTLLVTATVLRGDGTAAAYAEGTTVILTVGTATSSVTPAANSNTVTWTIDVPESGTDLSVKVTTETIESAAE